MGTAPPSRPLATPAKPFERNQRRACLTNAFVPKARKDPSVLLQLIARREWQKVLIRVTLFPSEVTQRQNMPWYGVEWSLLPLHLACALQPPPQVVAMLLHFHADTARVHMYRSRIAKKRRFRLRKKKRKPFTPLTTREYAAQQANMGLPNNNTAPSSDSGDGHKEELNLKPLAYVDRKMDSGDEDEGFEDPLFAMKGDKLFSVSSEDTMFYVFESSEATDSDADPLVRARNLRTIDYEDGDEEVSHEYDDKIEETSKNSLQRYLGSSGLALQLSYDGTLESITVSHLGLPSQPTRMHWDLDPLLMEADALLPLHIACLYRAAPQVVVQLLEAYPKGVVESALAMLPIHMVCAGFELPAPVTAPPSQVPFPMEEEFDLARSLLHLVKAFPGSLDYPSENHGMTPQMYIEETMDDGPYTDKCLKALGVRSLENVSREETSLSETDDTATSGSTPRTPVPAEVHCDDASCSTLPSLATESSSRYLGEFLPQINGLSGTPLYEIMVAKEWHAALDMIEEHPEQGSEWQYGIELNYNETRGSPQLWKRLPIHSACVLRAPVGVVEALHLSYPKGVMMKDPLTGALPLHLACRHSAPPDLVKGLVMVHPVGARVADDVGRLPLHQACLSGASRLTFTYLLQAYPHAVLFKDDKRKTPVQYAKANPTLKKETVELLEMIQYLLEKQPAFEDDYNFKGFLAPRRIQQIEDQSSIVSGFFEEEESFMGTRQPRADDELEKKLASIGTESPKEEGSQRSGSDDVHVNKLTRLSVSSAINNGGQSSSIFCLDGSPPSVTSFPDESTTTSDNELILCSMLDNVDGDILPDNVSLVRSHLNTTEGFQSATEEVLQPINNLTSPDESIENDGSIADDQLIMEAESTEEVERTWAGQAAGCDTSSSHDVPTAADQVTKKVEAADEFEAAGPLEAGKATFSIASHDDEDSGSNKYEANKQMSWLEVWQLALLASKHEVAVPVKSAEAAVSNAHEPIQADASPRKIIAVEAETPNAGSMKKDKLGDNEPETFSSCNASISSDHTIWHCNSDKMETSGDPFQAESEQYPNFKHESI